MQGRPKRFTPEFKEQAVRRIIENLDQVPGIGEVIDPARLSSTRAAWGISAYRGRAGPVPRRHHHRLPVPYRGLPCPPLSGKPHRIQRVPRFILAHQLDPVMERVRALECALLRCALLTARWSGARRTEIRKLHLDCLNAYPDGTPRLRLAAGKSLRERAVPVHEDPEGRYGQDSRTSTSPRRKARLIVMSRRRKWYPLSATPARRDLLSQ